MRPIVILARSTRSPLARFTLAAVVLLAACAAPTSEEGREDSQEAIGENAFCPVAASISQGYSGGHDGIDLAAPFGTPIYATQAGVVTASGPAQGYGQWIRIRHDDGSMTEYGHMQRRDVSVNQRVNGGQQIAAVGSEGQSSGPHLHLRTYARAGDGRGINPIDYLRARGRTVPCQPGQGSGPPPGGGGGGGGGGDCGVSNGKLTCGNAGSTPIHEKPWANSPVVNTLRTTRSWFSCWWSGEPHRGGNSIWYWTQGDDNKNFGFVPAYAIYTNVDPAPGLVRCGD